MIIEEISHLPNELYRHDSNTPSPFSHLALVIIASSGSVILMGILVMLGWIFKVVWLVQWHDNTVPMMYNTAFSFFLMGAGLALAAKGSQRWASWLGGFVFALSLATALQYAMEMDFGIDQFFVHHFITTKSFHPGRMAVNTTICFMLSGLGLVFNVFTQRGPFFSIVSGTLVFGFGLASITGYVVDLDSAYGWGNWTRMALHTALGFLLLGIGQNAYGWARKNPETLKFLILPFQISIFFSVIVFTSWLAVKTSQLNYSTQEMMHRIIIEWLPFFCSIITVVVSLLVHFYQVIQYRAGLLDKINGQLQAEIKERRAIEASMIKSNEQLLVAKGISERANQCKSEFLANMSHEIRTPMNAIIGLSDLAMQKQMSKELRDYLEKIDQSSRSLLNIINDILDFSKIDAGKLVLEQSAFLLRDVFDHLADLFRTKIAEKNIELIFSLSKECRYELMGDSLRVEQILINLVGNAIKFTNEGEIEVSVKIIDDAESQVTLEFSVRDTGIGIEHDQIDQLFEIFFQADSSITRKFGGTGLGLSISKRLVEMMGGRIGVDSKPGHGSIFYFTVNMKRLSGLEISDMTPPEDMKLLKVLVVDDNKSSRNAICNFFVMFGFYATSVSSGEEAIAAIQQGVAEGSPYRLVVLDWFMPKMDGIQTAQQLKTLIPQESLANNILLVPFGYEEKFWSREDDVGIKACLSKPINCSILFDTVMDIFGKDITRTVYRRKKLVDTKHIISHVGGAQVLLVEDNTINQHVARVMMEEVGLVVEIVDNGLEAVAKVSEKNYDIVLMDMQMPKMDGYQATRLLRDNPRFQKLPVIAVTAHAMVGDREKCLLAGMNDFLSKPIDRMQLYEKLIQWITPRPGVGMTVSVNRLREPDEKNLEVPLILPGIDVTAAINRFDGNHLLFRSLLSDFLRDYAQAGQQMRTFFSGNGKDDAKSAAILAHTIKGLAGTIEAKQLYDAALALEQAARRSQEERCHVLDYFEKKLGEVVASIQEMKTQEENMILAQSNVVADTNKQPLDMENIVPLMQNLFYWLQRRSSDAEIYFNLLKPCLANASIDVRLNVQQMEEMMDRFDYRGAQHLQSVIGKALDIALDDRTTLHKSD